jgi:membrane glycosyltransferase
MAIAAPLSVLSGSTRVGGALARIRVLATPEELRIPEIVRRRDSLCEQGDAASTGDPLRSLARDESARWWHVELNPAPPGSPRGQPDPDRLMARQKIQDARSLDEALGFLTARERLQVAADSQLLQRLASLPE